MLSDKSSVFLSLGSNLGHREALLRSAVSRLAAFLTGVRVSSIYETRPLYVVDQPMFLNIVLSGTTRLSPRELLNSTREIEDALGRDRSRAVAKGPRVLDIDILLYEDRIIHEADLIVPHPGMAERRFVLVPLLELAPDILNPRTGLPFARDLAALESRGANGAQDGQGIYTYAPWEYTELAGQG